MYSVIINGSDIKRFDNLNDALVYFGVQCANHILYSVYSITIKSDNRYDHTQADLTF